MRRESLPAALLEVGEQLAELVRAIVLGEKNGMLETLELPHGASQATVLNPAVRPTKAGDKVFCTVTGEVSGEVELSIDITRISEGKDVHFTLNAKFVRDHFEPNRGKKVTVRYRIWRATEKEMSYSEVLEFVIGTALELKSPRVKEADDTRLEPLNSQTHLTAIVDYDGMQIGDQIIAIWTGADGTLPEGSHTTEAWWVVTLGPQEVPLVTTVIAFSLGKTVTVKYTVIRGSGSPVQSATLTLSVLPLPDSVLVKPLILQAANNGEGAELDVSQLTANAVIRVNDWPYIALKQFVWLRVEGTNNDDSAYSQTFWQPPRSQTNPSWIDQGYYTHPIPLDELQNLKDGSVLKVSFKAGLSGSPVEDDAVSFQVRAYTIKALNDVKPEITTVTDSKGVEIPEGEVTFDTSVKLTGKASNGQEVEIFDGTTSKDETTANASTGIWELWVLENAVGSHNFTAKALYGVGQSSDNRTLIVAVDEKPVIASVTDSRGEEILDTGTTFDNSVMLKGTAAKRQKVQIYDGPTTVGAPVDVNPNDSEWTLPIKLLTNGPHTFTTKALYGIGLISEKRTMTLMVAPAQENFDAQPNLIIQPGKSVDIGSMVITNVSGSGIVLIDPIRFAYPGQLERQTLVMSGVVTILRIDLKSNYSEVDFWYTDVDTENKAKAVFYGVYGKLGERPLSTHLPLRAYQMNFKHEGIVRLEIESSMSNVIYLDNFSLKV
ncbi:hypothetical protein [Pseudomonas sp. RT6P73]